MLGEYRKIKDTAIFSHFNEKFPKLLRIPDRDHLRVRFAEEAITPMSNLTLTEAAWHFKKTLWETKANCKKNALEFRIFNPLQCFNSFHLAEYPEFSEIIGSLSEKLDGQDRTLFKTAGKKFLGTFETLAKKNDELETTLKGRLKTLPWTKGEKQREKQFISKQALAAEKHLDTLLLLLQRHLKKQSLPTDDRK